MAEVKNTSYYVVCEDTLVDLVTRWQNGDESAEETMFTTFTPYIKGVLAERMATPEDIEELAEIVFCEAASKISTLSTPQAFVSWIKTIAFRQCYKFYKKREREIRKAEKLKAKKLEDQRNAKAKLQAFLPSKGVDSSDLTQFIHDSIAKLPAVQREAITLHELQDTKVSDIAKLQKVSEGTVKSRLNYGRKKIRAAVEAYVAEHSIKL